MHTSRSENDPRVTAAQLIPTCQLCDAAFVPQRIRLLGESGHAQLLHAQCPRCHTGMVLLVLIHELGMGSVGLVTDLSEGDVVRLFRESSISTDDVLAISSHLHTGELLDSI